MDFTPPRIVLMLMISGVVHFALGIVGARVLRMALFAGRFGVSVAVAAALVVWGENAMLKAES